jgi:hypothetical protein
LRRNSFRSSPACLLIARRLVQRPRRLVPAEDVQPQLVDPIARKQHLESGEHRSSVAVPPRRLTDGHLLEEYRSIRERLDPNPSDRPSGRGDGGPQAVAAHDPLGVLAFEDRCQLPLRSLERFFTRPTGVAHLLVSIVGDLLREEHSALCLRQRN